MEFDELASGFSLLEAPCWDGAGGVYFSDVLQGGVRRWSDAGVEDVLPKRRGIGGMCLHADGGLVMSGRDVIHVRGDEQRVLLGGIEGVTGFNDLGTDADGRVYVGALRFNPFAGESPKPGQVWRIDASGASAVLEGIDWPNGIAFSPDGATMYACDYAHGTVLTGRREVFARSPAGSADGLAVDETGGVWVAMGEAGAIARFEARRLARPHLRRSSRLRVEPVLRRRRHARRLCDGDRRAVARALRRAGPARAAATI